MNILAIDPGTEQSAYVWLEGNTVKEAHIVSNEELESLLSHSICPAHSICPVACEWLEAMGMAVGREVFETVYWVGRFASASGDNFHRVTRREVKLHLCGNMRAKDPNIRQALIDKFGGSKEKAIGTKKSQGPLYGISSHEWSALAVGVTFMETKALALSR